MCMSTYDLLKQAIIDKQQVIGTYDGHFREMCPHCIGTKNGNEHVLVFQFGGDTSQGQIQPPGSWKCLQVDLLSNVSVRKGPWHTSNDHSKRQTCVDEVDLEVEH